MTRPGRNFPHQRNSALARHNPIQDIQDSWLSLLPRKARTRWVAKEPPPWSQGSQPHSPQRGCWWWPGSLSMQRPSSQCKWCFRSNTSSMRPISCGTMAPDLKSQPSQSWWIRRSCQSATEVGRAPQVLQNAMRSFQKHSWVSNLTDWNLPKMSKLWLKSPWLEAKSSINGQ